MYYFSNLRLNRFNFVTVQGIYAERLPRRFFFFSHTQDFAFASLEKMSTKTRVSVVLAGFQQVLTLQWKVRLKEVLTTENNIKMASGYLYTWFKDFESVFAFLLNSLI